MQSFLMLFAAGTMKKVLFGIALVSGYLKDQLPPHTVAAAISKGVFEVLAALGIISGGTSSLQPANVVTRSYTNEPG